MKRRLLVAGLALALGGCSTVGGWFGAGAPKVKPAALVEFKPSADLSEAWKAESGESGGYLLRPQAEGGDVFAVGGRRMVRIAVGNGGATMREPDCPPARASGWAWRWPAAPRAR